MLKENQQIWWRYGQSLIIFIVVFAEGKKGTNNNKIIKIINVILLKKK